MFTTAKMLMCLFVLTAGCATKPRRPSGALPPDWEVAHDQQPASEPAPAAQGAMTPPKVTPPAPADLGAVPPTIRPRPSEFRPLPPELTWISLSRWAAQRGFSAPHCLAVAPVASFAQSTTNGALLLQEGSLTAYWDRLEFRLGFGPQFIGGQIFLHALDLQKNIEPLLQGFNGVAKSNRAIVIDPAHGGLDSGTRSAADGRWEKEFTLDWAQRLAPLLERKGWRVFLTRTRDVDVSLPDRVAFSESRQADIFISLHFNSSGGGAEPAGLETYCLTPPGMPSSLTRGYPDDHLKVFPNNAFDAENLQLAMWMHRALLRTTGATDRGVRRARFQTVLRGQVCPAVLLEGGYLSNPEEARRIADPAYRQQLAEGVAKALE
jgi:N-acetylmuramoyl-L-alanine amidase